MKDHCREILEQAYLYLDDEVLTERQRAEIQQHLEDCAPCLERVGLEQEVFRVVARLKGTERCPEKLRQRISALIVEVQVSHTDTGHLRDH